MNLLLGGALNLVSGILGGHHVSNLAAGTPNALLSAAEGFGSRGLIFIVGTLYATNHGCRAAVNSFISAASRALIGA